jgi:uncharacterized protein (UPF0303 family)
MSESWQLDIETIAEQEKTLVFDSFDQLTALEIGNALLAQAKRAGHQIVVDIQVENSLYFFGSLPGTNEENKDWVRRKRNLFEITQVSSYASSLLRQNAEDPVVTLGLDQENHASHGGCFPIRTRTSGIIGSIVVSGIPSDREDNMLVVRALAKHLGLETESLEL